MPPRRKNNPYDNAWQDGQKSASASDSGADGNWITWAPGQTAGKRGVSTQSHDVRRRIRAQASRASASQRKATLAAKARQQTQQAPDLSNVPSGSAASSQSGVKDVLVQAHRVTKALAQSHDRTVSATSAADDVKFREFVEVLHNLQSQRAWVDNALQETSLSQKAIRMVLLDAMVASPTLFQSTLFMSGTFSNTCGLAPQDVDLGYGMVFMRGASLEAVNGAITQAESEHWTSMAVALLAGWELRFGDKASYEVHMRAYQHMFDAAVAFEERNITLLSDLAFEALREQLNSVQPRIPLRSSGPANALQLPPGFHVFTDMKPEVLSLLSIARATIDHKIDMPNAVSNIRGLGLQCMSWTPHHSVSVKPWPTFEADWDPEEMNALYHVRAAVLAIIAVHSYDAHTHHKAKTYLDIMGAADVHAFSCHHLRSAALIPTKYKWLVLWARFTLLAISRTSGHDPMVKQWMAELQVASWEDMKSILEAHVFVKTISERCRHLYQDLVGFA